ncbi:MAG: aldo/keto reductase family protein [Planctomycetota bacterium]|nr:aldo/keto reductase family protein [Planctomycetota bacterium]
MKYRRLGMWGLKLSEIGYGSWLTLNQGDQELAKTLNRTAYENGINFFDTANVYGRGQTEVLVGQALKPFRRDTFVLATKVFWPFQTDWPFPEANDRGLSRKHIFEQCHASLKRLDVDYIDLYQCHRYDENTPLCETCRAMSDLVVQGKTLYWGVSEWTGDKIAEAVEICDEHGWHRPVSNQPLYNMLERHWESECLPMCERLGLGIVNFSPLAEGLLTGKYVDGIPEGSRAADEKVGQFIKPRMTEENQDIVRKLKEVADGMGTPLSNLALAWCLARSGLTSVIVGASKTEQIVENVKACDLNLTDEIMERINAILGG